MSDGEILRFEFSHRTVHDLILMQESRGLNLSPGFQRNSVWSKSLRRKLMQSVFEGYPLPSIFLYRREENGRPICDVIDGKQRLETLFMFTRTQGFKLSGFGVEFQFPNDQESYEWFWNDLLKEGRTGKLLSYRIAVTEVSGHVGDIIDLFVRINSTGKPLTGAEKRNARYYHSDLLREADRLARKFRQYFLGTGVLSQTQVERMKDVELMSELLASVLAGQPIDQKAAIDKAIGNQAVNRASLRKASRDVVSAIRATEKMLPEIHATRFVNSSEFYSLVLVIWDLQKRKLILGDRRRTRIAQALLIRLSNEVDEARALMKRLKGIEKSNQLARDYLGTVLSGTDKISNRSLRATILRGLLEGLFEKKDESRLFSPEVRRLLWNSNAERKCARCNRKLGWHTSQIDHVKAHSKGGKTDLANAALLHARCNAQKAAA